MRYMASVVVLLALCGAISPASGDQLNAASIQSGRAISPDGKTEASQDGCEKAPNEEIAGTEMPVQRLMGMRVVNPLREEIGWVTDLILDPCGRMTHIVVHVGGFMGFGGQRVRLAVGRVRLKPLDDSTAWVALVRETRQNILSNHEAGSRERRGD